MFKGAYFLLLLFIINAYGSFNVKTIKYNEGDYEVQISFDDYELLKKYYLKEISYQEFEDQSLHDFKSYLRTALECETLTDENTLEDCALKLKNKKIMSITAVVPLFYDLNSKHLKQYDQNYFDNILKRIDDLKISDILEKHNIYIGAFSYQLTQFSFNTTENKDLAISLTNLLADYPQNTFDQEGYCDIEIAEDSTLFPYSKIIELSQFDKKKCHKLLGRYTSWTDSLYEHYIVSPQEVRIPKIHPLIKQEITKILTPEAVLDIYSRQLTSFFPKGLKTNLFMEHMARSSTGYLLNLTNLHLKSEEYLNDIAKTAPSGKITYDGVHGIHHYKDSLLRYAAVGLTRFITENPAQARKMITAENLSHIFKDTNSIDELTRLEPIDLISNLIYREVVNMDTEHRAGANLKNFFKEVLNYTTGLKEGIEHPLYIYPRSSEHSIPRFLCAYPKDTSKSSQLYQTIENWAPYYDPQLINEQDLKHLYREFICHDKKFSYKLEAREEEPLKIPQWKEISDGYIDILLPYSLTEELNDDLTKVAINYFKALRYKFSSKPISDVKSYVQEKLLTSDVLMPAGHAIASRDLVLGTEQGTLLSFIREKRKKDLYGVRFHFILPKKGSDYQTINIGELATTYQERMKQNRSSLLVFVISCSSAHNLVDWSLIYRRAIEPLANDPGLFPFVIASSRGFPTSSSTEIASNIFYPTDVADMLAKGYSPEEVYKDLQTRKYSSIAKEFLKRIGQAWLPIKSLMLTEKSQSRFGDIFEEPKDTTFSPEYNFSDKYKEMILKMAGTRHLLYQDDKLIMDETY